jgi:hypothetical protein
VSDRLPQIKFYADTHIAGAITSQLRNRGIDVVRCEEVGLANASDPEHLQYATDEGRIIITHDDDFLKLDKDWRAQGKKHAGILYCLPHLQGKSGIGKILSVCVIYHEMIAGGAGTLEGDIENQIIYVS